MQNGNQAAGSNGVQFVLYCILGKLLKLRVGPGSTKALLVLDSLQFSVHQHHAKKYRIQDREITPKCPWQTYEFLFRLVPVSAPFPTGTVSINGGMETQWYSTVSQAAAGQRYSSAGHLVA